MSSPVPLEENPPPGSGLPGAEPRAAGYAGRSRDAQLEYKAILANASIGIAFTRERKFTLCNPKFAEMLGWKAEELIGQPGDVVYPSRESYEALGAIAVPVLGAGRQLDVEWEVRRKDGSTFLARLIAKAVSTSDAQAGTVWIAEDITARKRQADEVVRLLREQEAILDTASIGICFVRERHIVRCNRRMEEMYGFAPGELNGKPTAITYAAESDYAKVAESYPQMARGQTHTHVLQSRRRDGTVFWQRATGRAVDPADALAAPDQEEGVLLQVDLEEPPVGHAEVLMGLEDGTARARQARHRDPPDPLDGLAPAAPGTPARRLRDRLDPDETLDRRREASGEIDHRDRSLRPPECADRRLDLRPRAEEGEREEVGGHSDPA